MIKHLLTSSLMAVLFLQACSPGSDPIVISDVDNEFYLEQWEVFDTEGRSLEWRLRTINSVECKGAEINFAYEERPGRLLSLTINQIVNQPNDCVPGNEPARANVDLGNLEPGQYALEISLRDAVNKTGTLAVGEHFYRIFLEEGSGVSPLRKELHRIPDQSAWGYVHAPQQQPELQQAADDFLAEWQELTGYAELLEGHYAYFRFDKGQVLMSADLAPANAKAFFRHLAPEQKAAAAALIDTYRSTHQGLEIKVYNTYGEEW